MLGLLLVEGFWGLIVYFIARKFGLRPSRATIALAFSSALPALAVASWGAAFWVERGAPQRPDWMVDTIWWLIYTSIAISLAAPLLAKGYRIPTAIFAVPQVPLAWFLGFIASMQLTGVWI